MLRAAVVLAVSLAALVRVAVAEQPPLQVTQPPASMQLPAFYRKYVSANGYPIVGSAGVNDYALKEAAYLINMLLANRPDVFRWPESLLQPQQE